MTNRVDIYKDLDFNFTRTATGDVATVINEEAIAQSVRNIILTDYQEKLFQAYFGGNVNGSLFELNTSLVKINIRDSIRDSLLNFEPRVRVNEILVTALEDSISVIINLNIVSIPRSIDVDITIERLR